MDCPACGFKNEDAAGACNLCGKLLAGKPAPPGPVAVAVPLAPGNRVPSWPNRAILCLLFTPALTLLLVPLLLLWDEVHGEEDPSGRGSDHLWKVILSGGYLIATVPLAARLALAPLLATALSGVVLILGTPFHSGIGSPGSWLVFGGLGMAWYARSAFTRPWDPGQFLGSTLQGYRRLLAPDRWAGMRLIGGILLFLGGIGFMVATGTFLNRWIPLSRPVAKFLAIPAFIGGFLAASGLSLSERAGPPP